MTDILVTFGRTQPVEQLELRPKQETVIIQRPANDGELVLKFNHRGVRKTANIAYVMPDMAVSCRVVVYDSYVTKTCDYR